MSAYAETPLPPSLYAETAIPPLNLDRHSGNARAGVVVIGGGITGLSAALHLAERGVDVVVLEAHQPGWGASGRNGGHVNPGLKHDPDEVERDFGDVGRRMVRFSYAAPAALFRLVERYQLRCEARQEGTLRAGTNRRTRDGLEHLAAQYAARGMAADLLDAAAAFAATGTRRYPAILRDRCGGSVNPLSYARGLADAAIAAGARLYGGSPAVKLARTSAGSWRVETPEGAVVADNLVIGTNGYTDALWPGLKRTIIPVFSGITATAPLPDSLARQVMPQGGVLYELGAVTVYYRLDTGNRLLIGGRSRLRDIQGPEGFRYLQRYAAKLWPGLTDVTWAHGWNGQLAMTADHYPHLHEPEPDVLMALGYNGRGVAMATAMGALIARRIGGERAEELDMPMTGITPIPFHGLWPLAVQARLTWGPSARPDGPMSAPRPRLLLRGARVLTEEGSRDDAAVLIENGLILDILDGSADTPVGATEERLPEAAILAPGFIDVQANGGGGVLFNETPTKDAACAIAAAHRHYGTTSLLPTVITDRPEVMRRAVEAAQAARQVPNSGVAGVHVEGPFISLKRPGVHSPTLIRRMGAADAAWFAMVAGTTPLLVTLAPEEVEDAFLDQMAAAGVIISAGHTAASAERLAVALSHGLRGFTHLYNAMPPMAGREPGPVGAALLDDTAWCGLIADGVHVHAVSLKLALATRPEPRMLLVTDAMSVLGTSAETFSLYGATMVRRNGRLEREDGTLAGADLDMATAVRNSVSMLGLTVERALRMASTYPAAFMRLADRGRISPGLRADLVLLTEALEVRGTWVGGVWAPA